MWTHTSHIKKAICSAHKIFRNMPKCGLQHVMLLWSIGRGWMCCFRAVGRLAISKMAFYMGCANASWWYRNALNAFMNVFNEFHLPYGTKRLTPRGHCANPKRHYFLPAAQGEPEQSKSNCHSLCPACVHRVCCAHRRTGLGTVCPGASGLVSRLNWITAGASAGSDEVASHDGLKVKEQPEREQRLCPLVRGRSVSDRVTEKSFAFWWSERQWRQAGPLLR